MTQPEALRLADNIEAGYYGHCPQAAAELRRLDAECNDLAHQLNQSNERNGRLIAQRDALLKVLKEAELVLAEKLRRLGADPNVSPTTHRIRAAIEAVEGENT